MVKVKRLLALLALTAAFAGCGEMWGMEEKNEKNEKIEKKLNFSEEINKLGKEIGEERENLIRLWGKIKKIKTQCGLKPVQDDEWTEIIAPLKPMISEQVDLENERQEENSDECENSNDDKNDNDRLEEITTEQNKNSDECESSSDENNGNDRLDETIEQEKELKVIDPEVKIEKDLNNKIEKNEQQKPCEAFILKIGELNTEEDNGIKIHAVTVNDDGNVSKNFDVTPTLLEHFYLTEPKNKKLEGFVWEQVATAWEGHDEKNENLISYVFECAQNQTTFDSENLEIILSTRSSMKKEKEVVKDDVQNVQLESIAAVIQNNNSILSTNQLTPLQQNTKKVQKKNNKQKSKGFNNNKKNKKKKDIITNSSNSNSSSSFNDNNKKNKKKDIVTSSNSNSSSNYNGNNKKKSFTSSKKNKRKKNKDKKNKKK